mmetsp:Transcript_31630/g.62581  ORF Transcript_31630/g.62581 Transcript_31630/m.62581 type:complete len:141 (+) Transcript_31630:218-640(+)
MTGNKKTSRLSPLWKGKEYEGERGDERCAHALDVAARAREAFPFLHASGVWASKQQNQTERTKETERTEGGDGHERSRMAAVRQGEEVETHGGFWDDVKGQKERSFLVCAKREAQYAGTKQGNKRKENQRHTKKDRHTNT